MSDLENAADPARGPGPWFIAGLEGNCSRCGDSIYPGLRIRADGFGRWECCDEDEPECHPCSHGGTHGADYCRLCEQQTEDEGPAYCSEHDENGAS